MCIGLEYLQSVSPGCKQVIPQTKTNKKCPQTAEGKSIGGTGTRIYQVNPKSVLQSFLFAENFVFTDNEYACACHLNGMVWKEFGELTAFLYQLCPLCPSLSALRQMAPAVPASKGRDFLMVSEHEFPKKGEGSGCSI